MRRVSSVIGRFQGTHLLQHLVNVAAECLDALTTAAGIACLLRGLATLFAAKQTAKCELALTHAHGEKAYLGVLAMMENVPANHIVVRYQAETS